MNTEQTPDDVMAEGLKGMYNLGLGHAIEIIKEVVTDKVEATILINRLLTLIK